MDVGFKFTGLEVSGKCTWVHNLDNRFWCCCIDRKPKLTLLRRSSAECIDVDVQGAIRIHSFVTGAWCYLYLERGGIREEQRAIPKDQPRESRGCRRVSLLEHRLTQGVFHVVFEAREACLVESLNGGDVTVN